MTTIVLPQSLRIDRGPVAGLLVEPHPYTVHHGADLPTLRASTDRDVEVDGEVVLVVWSSAPAPDATRNFAAERIMGFPVFGDAQVSSGSDENLTEAQIGAVLRKAFE